MGYARPLDELVRPIEEDRRCLQLVEEPHPGAEQHGHEVDRDLVDQAQLQALAGEVAWRDDDVQIARDRPRLLDGRWQPVGDERVGRVGMGGDPTPVH